MARYSIDVDTKITGAEKLDALDKQIEKLRNSPVNIKLNIKSDEINSLKSTLNKLSSEGKSKIKLGVDTSGAKSAVNSLKSDFQKLKSLQAELNGLKLKKTNLEINPSKNSNQINTITEQVNKLQKTYDNFYSKTSNKLNESQLNALNTSAQKAGRSLELANAKAKDLANTVSSSTKTFSSLDGVTASNKTLSWLKNNTKAAKDFKEALQGVAEKQRKASNWDELNSANKEFKEITTRAQALGMTGKSLSSGFKQAFGRIFQFSRIYGGINKVITWTTSAVSELKEMDTILTEISKVSDMTTSQINQLGKDSFDYASKYGKKVTDYLMGVTEMNRSGFYGKQGIELANVSVLAQAAGDMSADVANNYLLATNAAYKFAGSAEKLNSVLDGQNMITNRNSVNMTDMSEATSKAASMASQTGVSVEELSATIGTAVARTKQEGNVVGTALKSLFINLQDTSNKKIVGTFEELGISQTQFVNDSEQLKTPIELLRELANAYNTLPEGSTLKADVLRNIGNKRQANVLAAILAGIGEGDFDKMLSDYSEGKGSASIEAEKSANNWQGSLNKLSNSWTEFISNFAQSNQITGAIKLVNEFVQAMNSLVDVMTPLGTIGTGVGIFGLFKNLDRPINHRVLTIKFPISLHSESSRHKGLNIMAFRNKWRSMTCF